MTILLLLWFAGMHLMYLHWSYRCKCS